MIQHAPSPRPVRPRLSPTSSYNSTNTAMPSSHGRLHKRGNSASSIHSPTSPLSAVDSTAISFQRTETPRITYEEQIWTKSSDPGTLSSTSMRIKPYLRKLTVKDDSNAIDLSRPAAENESLAGLGLADYNSPSPSAADVNFSPVGPRSRHHRSTSNISQFSSSSNHHKPSLPYVHPMRQTPRPYTPPMARSELGTSPWSDPLTDHGSFYSQDETPFGQTHQEKVKRSDSISSSGLTSPPTLHTSNSGYFTRTANQSQTSLSISTPVTRPRANTLQSIDTATCTSPSSRPSFDKAFGFIRGRDSPIDPASRAASIRAARQAYQEKENAKDRRAEKEALKQAERANRKKARSIEQQQRKREAVSRDVSNEKLDSDLSIAGKEYSNHAPAHKLSLPHRVPTINSAPQRSTRNPSSKRTAKSRWIAFMTWFRTRLLRLGSKMK